MSPERAQKVISSCERADGRNRWLVAHKLFEANFSKLVGGVTGSLCPRSERSGRILRVRGK